ncbi:hypothetical protein OHB56_38170 [Streptomyces sp. NBC_01635]|uniref:hypothetical protein n=1 Tax=Streptomyces sp. NBC_01635 TaxID=2975904 RepID=UPI003867A220|nr:hypothetical protein OHB56_38170 [Streptomyces sp. NBC_01635]
MAPPGSWKGSVTRHAARFSRAERVGCPGAITVGRADPGCTGRLVTFATTALALALTVAERTDGPRSPWRCRADGCETPES